MFNSTAPSSSSLGQSSNPGDLHSVTQNITTVSPTLEAIAGPQTEATLGSPTSEPIHEEEAGDVEHYFESDDEHEAPFFSESFPAADGSDQNELDGNAENDDDVTGGGILGELSESLPCHHRPSVQTKWSLSPSSSSSLTPSWSRPSLHDCKRALETPDALNAFLEELLKTDGHVRHIGEWILFLLCACDADESVSRADADTQTNWCTIHLRNTISSAPQRVCPKSFTAGDIVWNCESCQRDSTCVQCQQCFSESNHEGHEVYFYQVGVTGGGCCDCGDDQAWNPAGFCSRHGSASTLESFPSAMRQSASRIFTYLAQWLSDNCLFVADRMKGRQTIRVDEESMFYVFGQETCGSQILPRALQRYGRQSLSRLEEVEEALEDLYWEGEAPVKALQVRFMRPEYLVCRRITEVVEVLRSITQTSDALVRILSDSLTTDHEMHLVERARTAKHRKQLGEPNGILEDLIVSDPLLPESVSGPLHLLYMRLLTDASFKERYAVSFAETYVQATIAATHAPEVKTGPSTTATSDQGIFGLSVQFLNRENFVNVLMREYDFMQDLLESWAYIIRQGNNEIPPPTFNPCAPPLKLRAYRHAITDMKYLLQCPGASRYLCFERPDLLLQWLQLLCQLQGMDPIERIPSGLPALPYEDEDWVHAVFLIMNIALSSAYLLRCLCLEDSSDWTFALEPGFVARAIDFASLFEPFIHPATAILKANVHKSKVSFSLPLYRFATTAVCGAAVACYSASRNAEASKTILLSLSRDSCISMVSASVRLLAASAQIRNRMWVRNGVSVTNRNLNYERGATVRYTRDLDIRSVQLAAVQLSGSEIVDLAARAFGVTEPLTGPWPNQSLYTSADIEYYPAMAEALLETLIFAVTEMPQTCTEEGMRPRDVLEPDLRRMLIHRLAEGPLPFTPIAEIAAAMPEVLKWSEDEVKRILDLICVARPSPDGMGATLYELLDDSWVEFDPTFCHQTREARERARDRWVESRAKLRKSPSYSRKDGVAICPPPPSLLMPAFATSRLALLRASFPLASRAFILAKTAALDAGQGVPTGWASTVTLPSLQLLTLLAYAGPETDDYTLWGTQADEQLLDALFQVATMVPAPPFDEVVQDGVRWLIARVSSISPEFAEKMRQRSPSPGGERDEQLLPTSGKAAEAGSGKKTKRNRAQEKAMAAMRAAAMQFGEQFADDLEAAGVEEPPTSKTKRNNNNNEPTRPLRMVQDPECCICRDRDQEKALSLLGFSQMSSVLFESIPDSHLVVWTGQHRVVSQCGHAMHVDCFRSWRTSAETTLAELQLATVEDRAKGEFLCPLCKTVCNILVPYETSCNAANWVCEVGSSNGQSSPVEEGTDIVGSNFKLELFSAEELSDFAGADEELGSSDGESLQATALFLAKLRLRGYIERSQTEEQEEGVRFGVILQRDVVETWIATICYIVANPLETPVSRWKTTIQSALSLARHIRLADLLEGTRKYWSFTSNTQLARTSPDIAAGICLLSLLQIRCRGEDLREMIEPELEARIENAFFGWFVVKVIQALIDPVARNESDSFVPMFDKQTPIQPPPVTGSAFAMSFAAEPVAEEEVAMLVRVRSAFKNAFVEAWLREGQEQSERDAEWMLWGVDGPEWEGEELVRYTRRQIAPFIELCRALAAAIGAPEWIVDGSRWIRAMTTTATLAKMETFVWELATSETSRRFLMDRARAWQFKVYRSPPPHPLRVRQLATLPAEYTELFALAQIGSPCSQCDRPGHEKAVCLICGKLVLAGADCSRSQQGEGSCTTHALQDHEGIGVFFVIQRSQVLLVNGIKQALWPSLYVDKNGEERSGPQRGLPLRLDARRLAKLQQTYASHNIPHEVAVHRGTSEGFIRDAYF